MIILKRNLKNRSIEIIGGKDDPKEMVAVDLTIGDRYRVPGKAQWFDFTDAYILRSGRCILIQTQEKLKLPANVFACVFSRGGLSAKGLVVSNTKTDPLFSGSLNIPVFNAGKQSIKLERGSRFCSIVFYLLEQPVPSDASRDPVEMDVKEQNLLIDALHEYTPQIVGAIVAILGSAIATYLTIKLTPVPQISPQQTTPSPQADLRVIN